MNNRFFIRFLTIAAFTAGGVGCAPVPVHRDLGPDPAIPDERNRLPTKEVVRDTETDKLLQEEATSWSRHQDLMRERQNIKQACYASCLIENTKRSEGVTQLYRIREEVKKACKSTGTVRRDGDVLTAFTPDTIITNPYTGRLEIMERNFTEVHINPTWKCPSNFTEEQKIVAERYMNNVPEDLKPKYCERIESFSNYRPLTLEQCERWVREPGIF